MEPAFLLMDNIQEVALAVVGLLVLWQLLPLIG